MSTKFKLLFEGKPDLDIDKFQQSLPSNFKVTSESDGIYVAINSTVAEDRRCQYVIDRELDRHFFLTCVKIRAEMVCTRVQASLRINYRIHGALPDGVRPQNWSYELPIQLKLWSIATDTMDVCTKLILLFQIIELAYPKKTDYPKYDDSTRVPHPLTECKLIRHLVVHSGNVSGAELKCYCEHIGLPAVMLDITDPEYHQVIASKVTVMETEARKAIENVL